MAKIIPSQNLLPCVSPQNWKTKNNLQRNETIKSLHGNKFHDKRKHDVNENLIQGKRHKRKQKCPKNSQIHYFGVKWDLDILQWVFMSFKIYKQAKANFALHLCLHSSPPPLLCLLPSIPVPGPLTSRLNKSNAMLISLSHRKTFIHSLPPLPPAVKIFPVIGNE